MKLKVDEAIGRKLALDVTILTQEGREIIRRGTVITRELAVRMKNAGHNVVYVIDETKHSENIILEDKAVLDYAEIVIGRGCYIANIREGSAYIKAKYNGLLKVNVDYALKVNETEDLTLITRENFSGVLKDELICILHIKPPYIEKNVHEKYINMLKEISPVIEVKPFIKNRIGLIITGTEVYEGIVEDRVGPIVESKVKYYGGTLVSKRIIPDDVNVIKNTIMEYISNKNIDIVIITGGMSVDPTDLTPKAIAQLRAKILFHGVPIKPNTMTLLATLKGKAILGIPSGIMHYPNRNILDIILPRLMAGEIWSKREIIVLGVGGLMEEFIRKH